MVFHSPGGGSVTIIGTVYCSHRCSHIDRSERAPLGPIGDPPWVLKPACLSAGEYTSKEIPDTFTSHKGLVNISCKMYIFYSSIIHVQFFVSLGQRKWPRVNVS